MTTTTAPAAVRMYVEIDGELAQAMDRARKDMRLSRPNFLRTVLSGHLLQVGALAPAVREPAR